MTNYKWQMSEVALRLIERDSPFVICHLQFVILKEPKRVQWSRLIG
jgi:hypothetical protein